LKRSELLRLAAALEHQNALAYQVFRAGGTSLSLAIDDLGGDFKVGVGESSQFLASFAGDQTRRGKGGAARTIEAGKNLFDALGSLYLQFDAELAGKAFGQLVLEAGVAIAVLEVSGRAVAGNHAQYAFLLNTLKR